MTEIRFDGVAVWVSTRFGDPAGKFGPLGAEVLSVSCSGITCHWAELGKPDLVTWLTFCRLMREQHGVNVPARTRPRWLVKES